MPVHAIADQAPAVQDWSSSGSRLRGSKPRWVREMAWTPLVAPLATGRVSSTGATAPPKTPAVAQPKPKRTCPSPSPWAQSTPRAQNLTAGEKDNPCVGQYHVAVDCVLPRAPTTRICEPVGGSRLPPEESQSARPSSAPGYKKYEEGPQERIIESIRGKSPAPDFGRSTPRPDKITKGESFWEVMEEKDVTKLSTHRRTEGHKFGVAARGGQKVEQGASWPPNVSYKHCSNEHKTRGTVAFDKQPAQRFREYKVPIGVAPVAGAHYPVKGFWDRVSDGMRHERHAVHDDDRAIQRRPKSVMDFSKTTGRPLLTPEPKASSSGRQSTSPGADAPRMSSFQDPSGSGVPHLPEDPVKPSPTWYQFTGRAPSPKGASRSSTPGGRKVQHSHRDNKGFAHDWALEECRRITEWFEWRHGKNQDMQGQEVDAQGAPSPRRFL